MNISEKGLNLIKEFEGCILQSYDDYNEKLINNGDCWKGTLTIGYGHIENVYPGEIISLAEAEEILKNDMVRYENMVQELINEGTISFQPNQNQFDALVSFCYNCGQGNLRTLCNGRDPETIAEKMLLYNKGNGQTLAGLIRRRKAERSMFLGSGNNVAINNPVQATTDNIYLQLQRELNAQGFKDKNGNKLIEDGIPGELTLSACPVVKKGASGNITTWIQLRCGATPDGIFGTDTENAVKYMQHKWGLEEDGIVGPLTWSYLLELK